ncbi:hypothetical protein ACHMW7_19270 [Aminobacter sp. UC22_36]|uniref:hypothetical protein n=1 Tax=Aminobacter sp. UC22_36 TaxID=3374549 RepID=UPI0037574AD8
MARFLFVTPACARVLVEQLEDFLRLFAHRLTSRLLGGVASDEYQVPNDNRVTPPGIGIYSFLCRDSAALL